MGKPRTFLTVSDHEKSLRLLYVLIQRLPEQWTQAERERWLRAFRDSVDLLVEITDVCGESGVESAPQGVR